MLAASDRMRVVLARPTEPNRYISKRLGVALTRPERRRFQTQKKGEVSLMEQHNEELKAHLMATDQQFRTLAEEHAQFHKQLEMIESKEHLTLEDEAEEIRLKKQKLRLKDQMNAMLARYRAQQVA
jgi:uncharacterized protein YdcH (DUF465 family)